MRASVDDDRCRGHGICVAVCPEIFTLTDDGYAVAADGDVPESLQASAVEAAEACPEHAITVG
ncbi:ferredoxin [Mycobacterium sp. MYCO198283]|uniref:ferredoxin n=1 Tax=Mycobacterium sp. MYCO198283 TaxID=2883505 RepID=UPI001E433F34|nr:ferredoxin [Mycobacterium sp. MYCO198283]MCG5433972.1 ferredoxin [Mycobacterium sp. MYCO198283]